MAPDESRVLTFRTIWGDQFKDAVGPAFAGKRCEHGGYAPGERVCTYLMEHGSMEFSEKTAKEAITCLCRGTQFGRGLELRSGSFTLRYGGDYRGADVDIAFAEDAEVGGMALKIEVEGF